MRLRSRRSGRSGRRRRRRRRRRRTTTHNNKMIMLEPESSEVFESLDGL